MKVLNLEQRSSEWLLWRNAGIGSSEAAAIVGLSPWTTADKLLAQKVAGLCGRKQREKTDNGAMARGRQLEPKIIAIYEDIMGWKVPAVCGIHDEHDWLKVSLDGWNAERSLFVEVKAPNRDDHALALAGGVPDKYVPQLIHQYLVSGAKSAHYISYSDYFPESKQLAVVAFPRDEELIATLFVAERDFWQQVVTNVAEKTANGKEK